MLANAYRATRSEIVPGAILRIRDDSIDEWWMFHIFELQFYMIPSLSSGGYRRNGQFFRLTRPLHSLDCDQKVLIDLSPAPDAGQPDSRSRNVVVRFVVRMGIPAFYLEAGLTEVPRMDGQRFDALARTLASGMTRRRGLKAFIGAVGGAALAAIGLDDADAKHVCRVAGQVCRKPGDCCSRFCGPANQYGRQYCDVS